MSMTSAAGMRNNIIPAATMTSTAPCSLRSWVLRRCISTHRTRRGTVAAPVEAAAQGCLGGQTRGQGVRAVRILVDRRGLRYDSMNGTRDVAERPCQRLHLILLANSDWLTLYVSPR